MIGQTVQIGPHRVTITAQLVEYARYIVGDLTMSRRHPGQGYRSRANRTLAKVDKILAAQAPALRLDRAQTLRFVNRLCTTQWLAEARSGK